MEKKEIQTNNENKISEQAVIDIITAVMERQVKRWFVIALIIFIAFVLSNAAWIYHESQYVDVVTETYSAESDSGGTAIVNGDGSITVNGESELHENN